MKKMTFILALATLLFASCKFTGPEGKLSGEKTSFEVSAYDIMAGLLFEEIDDTAGAGAVEAIIDNIYTISLEITGTVPEGVKVPDPITGTKLSDFAGKSFIINDLPVGEKFQFTLRVKDLGGELYEGTSDTVTITADMQTVPVSMNRVYDYLPLYNYPSTGNSIFVMKNLKNKNDIIQKTIYSNTKVRSYTTDDEGNLYTLEIDFNSEDMVFYIVRYSPKTGFMKGEKLAKIQSSVELNMDFNSNENPILPKFVYDKTSGNLFLFNYCENALFKLEIENVKKAKAITSDSDFMGFDDLGFFEGIDTCTVANGNLYVVDFDANLGQRYLRKYALSALSEGGNDIIAEKSVQLTYYTEDQSYKLLDSIEIFGDYFKVRDIGVSDKGIFLLCSEFGDSVNGKFPLRGGVIIYDTAMTSYKTIGFTKSWMAVYHEGSHVCDVYGPKSINDGFYCPDRIFAIKEKELVFVDDGKWIDYEESKVRRKLNMVTVNLASMTWTAENESDYFDYDTGKYIDTSSNCQFDAGEWVD